MFHALIELDSPELSSLFASMWAGRNAHQKMPTANTLEYYCNSITEYTFTDSELFNMLNKYINMM